MEDPAFPSDGSPPDVLGRHDSVRIDNLCTDMKEVRKELSEVKENVAYIRGKMEGGAIQQGNSTKLKATVIGSLIMGLSGIIVAVISFFKS